MNTIAQACRPSTGRRFATNDAIPSRPSGSRADCAILSASRSRWVSKRSDRLEWSDARVRLIALVDKRTIFSAAIPASSISTSLSTTCDKATEHGASSGQDHAAYFLISLALQRGGEERVGHRHIDRVAGLRPIERDRGHRSGSFKARGRCHRALLSTSG